MDTMASLKQSSGTKLQDNRLILSNIREVTNAMGHRLLEVSWCGCRPCRDSIIEFGKQEQKGVWWDLPKIFDIVVEGWTSRLPYIAWW